MISAVSSERIELGNVVCLKLAGIIDESLDAAAIFHDLPANVVLDLQGIKRITSFGVRQWSDAMKMLKSNVQHLYLLRAPSCFIDQLNMVLNFGGRSEVITATALYFCEKCQEERAVPIDVLGDHALLLSGAAPAAPCPTCSTPMALEDDPQQAFRYVANYGAKTLSGEVVSLLAHEKLYVPSRIGPPPEEMKLVHGEVTLLVLSGTLDQRFRPRRLSAGVEGQVVLDVGGVAGIDATGVERFRNLLSSLEEAGSVTLVDVGEPLLREIASGNLPLGRARVASGLLSFQCASCGAEHRATVTREQGVSHQPPCDRCGEPTKSGTAASWLARAFSSQPEGALPPAVAEVVARRSELMSRARAESGVRDSVSADPAGALGRYRVLRPLSRGGMAEILLAVHEGIGGFEKLIALKKIRRKLLERRHVAVELFLNEAKIVANLNHPNIVQTFEVGEHGGDLFIAMEYVHGVDARTLVKHRVAHPAAKISLEQVLYIGTQVAAALDHAHKARDLSGRPLHIVHRDVSLSNIVLGFDGQVKLVDFGIATAASVAAKDGLIGKFSYMSPEQVAKEPLDGRSDIFSLGIVLVEMITGVPLFRRGTDDETLRAVREDSVPSLAPYGLLPEAEEVLRRALTRNRDERYADARAFELALQSALQKHGGMSAHQLSMRMRELFPELSAAAPTALTAVDASKTPSNTSDSSGSRRFVRRSNTFAAAPSGLGESDNDQSVTSDLTPGVVPVVMPRVDSVPTPRLGTALAEATSPTPSTGVKPLAPAQAGEGVHFNRKVELAPRDQDRIADPPIAAPTPRRDEGGAPIALIIGALLLVAAALAWLFLRS